MLFWHVPLLLSLGLLSSSAIAAVRSTNSVNTWAGPLNYTEDWAYVNVHSGAHLFWWLYAASPASSSRPLFLWLQGGPGSSGVGYGSFEELGPKDLSGNDRASTWLQVGDLVFVDNPVGTGFSYVENSGAYTKTVEDIGKDLLGWAISFFSAHPEYRDRVFYIVCESYGGKMTAEFARVLNNAVKSGVVPLKKFGGVALGDSWISPMDYVNTWGPYLYANSYLDEQQLQRVNKQAATCQNLVDNGKWTAATDCWDEMEGLVGEETGGVSWYNVLKYGGQDDWSSTLNKEGKRTSIERLFDRHVRPLQAETLGHYMDTVVRNKLGIIPANVHFGGQSGQVFAYQSGDFMKPNYATVDELLKQGLQVTVFNGQLDLICDTLGTEKWITRLQWPDLKNFLAAPKKSFETKNFRLAGFTKAYKNLQLIYILRAGHMVAHDTEESGLYVLKQLMTKSKQFF